MVSQHVKSHTLFAVYGARSSSRVATRLVVHVVSLCASLFRFSCSVYTVRQDGILLLFLCCLFVLMCRSSSNSTTHVDHTMHVLHNFLLFVSDNARTAPNCTCVPPPTCRNCSLLCVGKKYVHEVGKERGNSLFKKFK